MKKLTIAIVMILALMGADGFSTILNPKNPIPEAEAGNIYYTGNDNGGTYSTRGAAMVQR